MTFTPCTTCDEPEVEAVIVWRDEVHSSGYNAGALALLVGREQVEALAQFACAGPTYMRAVADELYSAARCAQTGNPDSARYCFGNAEVNAALVTKPTSMVKMFVFEPTKGWSS